MKRTQLFVVGVLSTILWLAFSVAGATLTVTKTADTNDGVCDADCSLREAVAAANASAENDDIVFSSATFTGTKMISLAGTQITIANNGSLSITGSGRLTISGEGNSRVFVVDFGAVVTLKSLSVRSGQTVSFGGGIYNGGTLSFINSNVVGCNAGSDGGGIANFGTLYLTNSTITSNTAYSGAGIYNLGTLRAANSTITANSGFDKAGIEAGGGATTIAGNTIIAGNMAAAAPKEIGGPFTSLGYNLIGDTTGTTISGTTTGNILNANPQLGPLADNGGPTSTHTLLSGSQAIDSGSAALAVDSANQPLTVDQRGFRRSIGTVDIGAFELNPQPFLIVDTINMSGTLTACTAAPNDCSLRGAITVANSRADTESIQFDPVVFAGAKTLALSNAELAITKPGELTIVGTGANRLTISAGNSSRVLNVAAAATVTISGVTLANGYADFDDFYGGVVYNLGHLSFFDSKLANGWSRGGGVIYSKGTVNLTNSTVTGGSAQFHGGGGVLTEGPLHVYNSTISNNTTSMDGGGISVDYNGSVTLVSSTICGNYSVYSGGGLSSYFEFASAANTIIAGNSGGGNNREYDFYGQLTSLGYNLIGTSNGYSQYYGDTTGNLYNIDPQLGPLQDNGGPTPTHAPSMFSPAINAGSTALAVDQSNQPFVNDQRGAGFSRVVGSAIDIGAVETDIALLLRVDTVTDSAGLTACTAAAADCSLRGAVTRANAATGNIVISFEQLGPAPQTITLTGATELPVTGTGILTFFGPGAANLTISGNNAHRVLNIASGSSVVLQDLTIAHGRGSTGGGLVNNGTLTVSDAVFASNYASVGSGFFNFGTALVSDSAFTGNQGDTGGGISNFNNNLTVINSTFSNNQVASYGGAIYNNNGTVKVINSTLYNNAADIGGGVYQGGTGVVQTGNSIIAGNIGGYQTPDFRGTLTSLGYNLIGNTTDTIITGTTTGNRLNVNPQLGALGYNGGPTPTHAVLAGSPVIDAGVDALAVDQNSQPLVNDQRGAGFGRFAGGRVDIGAAEYPAQLLVTNTSNSGAGSFRQAITTANSTNFPEMIRFSIPGNDPGCSGRVCTIAIPSGSEMGIGAQSTSGWLSIDGSGNFFQPQISGTYRSLNISGGAVVSIRGMYFGGRSDIASYGTLSIYDTSFLGNTTVESWGTLAIENSRFKGNGGSSGITNGGTANISNVTISGAGNVNYGGAIRNYGDLTLTNSTISGNTSAQSGGGLHNTGTFTLINSTVAGNSTQYDGGGINVYSGTFNIRNSIVADNTSGNSGPDVYGTLNSQGYNLIGNSANAAITGTLTGNRLDQNAKLAPLGYYGGTMETRALLAGSPAINNGNSSTSPATDQRGATRVGTADIGAFELNNNANGGSFVAALSQGNLYSPYEFLLTDNGPGTTYAVTSGALPNGLALTSGFAPSATMSISGTPSQIGTFNFAVTATNASGSNVTNYSMLILGPTAANVAISGRVLTSEGRGLTNATVSITDQNGSVRSTRTGTFGYFRFDDLAAGEVYVVEVNSKRFQFSPQVVSPTDAVTEVVFVGN